MDKKKEKNDNMLFHVTKAPVEPKIYAATFSDGHSNAMGACVAYTLEDALLKIRQELGQDVMTGPFEPRGWTILSIGDLKKRLFDLETSATITDRICKAVTVADKRQVKKEVTAINELMLRVIENSDMELYRDIEKKLTPMERKYVLDKLKPIKK